MRSSSRPPGPRLPMLGTLITPGRDPLALFTRLAREYGDIVHFRMSGERVFFLNHPEYIRQVLMADGERFAKSRALERARTLLGDGLLTSAGQAHRRRRRLVQPAFHHRQIAGYAAAMVEGAQRAAGAWAPGEPIDVSRAMMRLTLSIVARTLFSTDIDAKADAVGRAITDVLESFWLTLLPFSDVIEALPLSALRRSRRARADLDALIYEMIAERRRGGGEREDVLSMLTRAREDDAAPLTDREVRDEAMTLLIAGHETTANALTWTWYLLAQSEAAAARLHEEIDRVLQGQPPGAGALEALPFTTSVVTEAMRLYPPAWVIGRRALQPFEVGGYRMPARSLVFMSQWTMHRDPRFYAEPERFLPERWTPEFRATLPRYAYFPFGGGSRRCIGEAFAWMELVVIVATIAQQWELRLVPGHPVATQPLLTLRAKHGMRMTPHRRG